VYVYRWVKHVLKHVPFTLQVKLTIPKVEPADGCLSKLEKKLEKVLE
jgi:hypothetical protein